MLTSVRWLNRYLSPADLTPDEAERLLTNHSFPIESREDLAGGDCRLDVELTSNRGDCACHLGLAREIAASTGRTLAAPPRATLPVAGGAPMVSAVASVENRVPALCPRFTARVIRNVKVGPSPQWLVQALESVGQRSINNIVDVSNFVLLELGNPSHTFDLNTLSGRRLIVRHANAGERLACLDGRTHSLIASDLVVADENRAVSLAGVVGGTETGVTERTRDVLLEVATWDPVTIRRTARRLMISTDAGYRFERRVDPRDLARASDRIVELILQVAGGELCGGMIDEGDAAARNAPPTAINLRLSRAEHLLGIAIPAERMTSILRSLGFGVEPATGTPHDVLRCTVPHDRWDVTREVDLIEEVVRIHGIDKIEVASRLPVEVKPLQPGERAVREACGVLTGLGFFETVTFTFISEPHAAMFLPATMPGGGPSLRLLRVEDERRKGEPVLRPSVIPSLLTCRRANQDARNTAEGGVRLFEIASVFAELDDGKACARRTIETRNLALLADAPPGLSAQEGAQAALRIVRSAIDAAARALGGSAVRIEVAAAPGDIFPALAGGVSAGVTINGARAGYIGVVGPAALKAWGLDQIVAVAEVNLDALVALYPPRAVVSALPAFPSIERDLSLVVDEATAWARFEELVRALKPERLVGLRYVGVYRGKQVGAGKKSVTLRLEFRDDARTLRHEEVDPQVNAVVEAARRELGAELRA